LIRKVKLSFVMPAYNEEYLIENALGMIDKVVEDEGLRYEIVVVDDGSTDETLAKAVKYASRNGHVQVISYPKNVGKGYAVRAGFMHATGDAVVFVDSDLEIDLELISDYVRALEYGDIAIGSKWHPDSLVDMPLFRRILSHSFNVLIRIFTGANLKDTQVGLKAMKRSAFAKILPRLSVKRYAFDVELLTVANLYGLKIIDMPTRLRIKEAFDLKEMLRMFVDLLGIAYRLRVNHWYQQPIGFSSPLVFKMSPKTLPLIKAHG